MIDQRSFYYLSQWHIVKVLGDLFVENLGLEATGGIPASSDEWGLVEEMRQSLYTRAKAKWAEAVDLSPSWFPYGVDGVVRLYFRFRKRNAAEIAEFRAVLEAKQPG